MADSGMHMCTEVNQVQVDTWRWWREEGRLLVESGPSQPGPALHPHLCNHPHRSALPCSALPLFTPLLAAVIMLQAVAVDLESV